MISDQSKNYFSFYNSFKYEYFKFFYGKRFDKFFELIKYGTIPRPNYALGILMAAHQAKELGYKKISIIELGCWNFEGLIDIENYIHDIKKFIDIDFNVYGFELGTGHIKEETNPRNRLYELSGGDYTFKKKDNLKKLQFSELVLGDVKDTVPKFLEEGHLDEAPLGFIIFDLGFYTSAKNALQLLNSDSKRYLPRSIIYSDNNYFVLKNEADKAAFSEFNKEGGKMISPIGELAEQLSVSWNKWIFLGKRMYMLSDLKHEKYNINYEQKINKLINSSFSVTLKR
mgnify:FL=1|jgi:hypothetical protein|tara:strand:- start:259 stop:1113 length:855 start_codon:yes stop_codon:yes gene_type:complete